MKKTLSVITLLAGAVSGYSQGEIVFQLYNAGATGTKQAIYNTQLVNTYSVTYGGSTVMETVGSTPTGAEYPKGTTVYTGSGLSGTAYDVELLAGPGGITTPGGKVGGVGLTPVSDIFNFKTGASTQGLMNGGETVTLPTESYFAGGQVASVAIAAWSSTYSSLTAAIQSGVAGVWGISPVAQTGALPVSPAPAEALPTGPGGIESFSLGTVPEPSTIALGVMGASTLLFRRRK